MRGRVGQPGILYGRMKWKQKEMYRTDGIYHIVRIVHSRDLTQCLELCALKEIYKDQSILRTKFVFLT